MKTRRLTAIFFALVTVTLMISSALAASYSWCPRCDSLLDSRKWDADETQHFQYCSSCKRFIYEDHTFDRYDVCTICGYDAEDDLLDDEYFHDECEYCGHDLDEDEWYYSSRYPNGHVQTCFFCDTLNYRSHVYDRYDNCVYCDAYDSEYIGDISVTIDEDFNIYYFSDDETESGYSVYDLICEEIPFNSNTDLDDYYITFDRYTSSLGTLHNLDNSDGCWLSELGSVYLAINNSGTWTADYVISLGSKEVASGTLSIVISADYSADYVYTATLGETVALDMDDFIDFWDNFTDGRGSLSHVRIDYVEGLSGTVCYNHTSSEKNHTSASGGTFYASPTSKQKDLNKLSFVPSKVSNKYKTGTVTISFTAYGSTRYNSGSNNNAYNSSASGHIIITFTNGDVSPITYTTFGSSVTLNADDFNKVYNAATESSVRNPSYTIQFLDVPAYGTLYYNYKSSYAHTTGTELTERNIATLIFSNRTNNHNSIADIVYVPTHYTNFEDTVRYAVYSGSKLLYAGELTFKSKETVISYGCTSDGVRFSANDFLFNNPSLYSHYIVFGIPSSGTLYKDYDNKVPVTSLDYFSYSATYGVNDLNNIVYVPYAGYVGVVNIPFYSTSIDGGTVTGTVRIYTVDKGFSDVDNSRWSAPYINRLYASGVVGGTSATTFSPKANMKYGEALKMILLAAGYPQQSETGGKHWASNYLSLAYKNGIVSSTNIDLNALVNRDTVAELAAKALGLAKATSVNTGIIAPSDSTNGYVYALYNAGIVGGEIINGASYYYGSRNITREEVTKIICNIMDYER